MLVHAVKYDTAVDDSKTMTILEYRKRELVFSMILSGQDYDIILFDSESQGWR